MTEVSIALGEQDVIADASGALLLPHSRTLVVADLHLEKGSAFARRGSLLPPYDTRTTIGRIETLLDRHAPERVVSLGDGFHDRAAAGRLGADDRARLTVLIGRQDWIWVTGNHDPEPPEGLPGQSMPEIGLDGIVFRHEPGHLNGTPEVAGHLHPKTAVRVRGRRLSRSCFVTDPDRMILPAFGCYTGGLDIDDPALAPLFPDGRDVYALGRDRVFQVALR